MINLVLAYDDNDSELGLYFEEGFNQINLNISQLNFITLKSIQGLYCTLANTNGIVRALNHQPFIFVGLCHGSRKELVANEAFVDFDSSSNYNNSLFYTVACSSSYSLGKKVITEGGKCYVGYFGKSYATYEDFNATYIECENYAINEFLRTDKTIGETFEEMKELFNDKIYEMYLSSEILVAMELERNLNNLSIRGDRTLTRNHFRIS